MTSAEADNNEGEAGVDADNANAVEVETPTSTSGEGNSGALPASEAEQTTSKPDEITPTIDEAGEAAAPSPNQSVEGDPPTPSTESPPTTTDIVQLESPSTEQSDEVPSQCEPLLDSLPIADPGTVEAADCSNVSAVVHQDESSALGTPDSPAVTVTQEVLPSGPAAELEVVNGVAEVSEAATVVSNEDQSPPVAKPKSATDPPASTEANTEQQSTCTTEEAGSQDDIAAPEDADSVEQAKAELSSHQSSASLPAAKPSGFLDSLTAEFAADTKAAWAQIFGPRYEEGDEDADSQADNQSVADSTAVSVSSRISFKAKLARERKLDEQIQASQRRYRERVLRNTAANNASAKRDRTKASRRPQAQIPTLSPFERAGLSLTQVRFCTEKALDETCKCFRYLYATAMEEPEEPVNPPTQGVFITQGELEILLRELFDPQEPALSNSNTRRGTVAGPLGFTSTHDAGSAEGIPMSTQLQASWFIPFGQLPQLRSLVMKITKRHLNEDKLAIVNRHLQKQLTLLPLSAKVQDLVLQLSNYQMKEPPDVPLKQRLRSSVNLAQELLTCIAVSEVMSMERQTEDYQNFLLFLPVELVAKTQLSSVVCAQRLVFFRFLIDIIAAERSKLHSESSTESLPPAMSERTSSSTHARRKTMVKRRSSSRSTTKRASGSDDTPQDAAEPTDNPPGGEEVTSIHAAHGSVPSTSEAEVHEASGDSDPFEPSIDQVGDECEKPASQLQQQLEAAITQLQQTLPTINSELDQDAKIYAVNPAIRATYLAAVACQQSVHIMLENNIDVDSAMSDKLRHFVEALATIQLQSGDQVNPSQILPPPLGDEQVNDHPQDAPKFPPPYPESTVPAEEIDDHSESGTIQTQFPPPYAITAPSYWTFAPSIPEPKSSIAKLASKSPSNKSADLRRHFMSRDSPGVGAYNIQRGERLTFEQRPSYSFGSTGETPSKGQAAPRPDTNAATANGSARKPSARPTLRHRMKSSLAFAPPMLRPPEEEEEGDEEEDHESVRVHVASQCDDSRLQTSHSEDLLHDLPPHYGAEDANEAPDERFDGGALQDLSVETEMDRALRLQQQLFMSEFVQQVVSNQDSPSHFVPRVKPSNTDNNQRSRSRSKPYWATSEVSPGIEKLLQRQRRAPSASKSRPTSASTKPNHQPRSSGATNRKAPPSPPPRRQLDNDQHLAWAARISELYQPTVEQ